MLPSQTPASPIGNPNRRSTLIGAPSLKNLNTVRTHSSGVRPHESMGLQQDNNPLVPKSNYFVPDNNSFIAGSFEAFDQNSYQNQGLNESMQGFTANEPMQRNSSIESGKLSDKQPNNVADLLENSFKNKSSTVYNKKRTFNENLFSKSPSEFGDYQTKKDNPLSQLSYSNQKPDGGKQKAPASSHTKNERVSGEASESNIAQPILIQDASVGQNSFEGFVDNIEEQELINKEDQEKLPIFGQFNNDEKQSSSQYSENSVDFGVKNKVKGGSTRNNRDDGQYSGLLVDQRSGFKAGV